MYIFNPLEQFEVYSIISSITNLALFLILNFILFVFFVRYNAEEKLILSRSNIVKESLVSTVTEVVRDQIGKHFYFPFILSLFFFILISNLLGMIPYSFTPTSHIVVTMGFSVAILIGVTIIGLQKHSTKFFSLFLPAGIPVALIPLLTSIELISYLARALSLGIRLFANIVAGHCLLHILAGFSWKFVTGNAFFLLKLLPFFIISIFIGLELVIGFLQAYVFICLTSSYIKDVL